MPDVSHVLASYNLRHSVVSQVSERLFQINNANSVFALKWSRLNAADIRNWKSIYHTAEKYNLKSVLPVYLTSTGEMFDQHDGEIYYLSPWKKKKEYDEPVHQLESFYQALGIIHNRTKQTDDLTYEKAEEIINQEKQYLDEYRKQLLSYVEQFEARHYIAPFELLVCMQYRDIEKVVTTLYQWFDYYLEDIKNDKYTYHALCHGNLRNSHIIYQHNQTHFINWERAFYGNSVMDLAIYYYNECKYHDASLDELVRSFSVYEKYNPLLQSEKSLLAIYVLTPRTYLDVINGYVNKRSRRAQPFHIRSLEYAYRRLMQGLRMGHHLLEERQEATEQKQEG